MPLQLWQADAFARHNQNAYAAFALYYGMLLALMLSFALADRINTLRREKELAQSEALAAKQTMVETLRTSERELEARVAARTGCASARPCNACWQSARQRIS